MYRTRRFITEYTTASNLSYRRQITQSTPTDSVTWRWTVLLCFHLLLSLTCGHVPQAPTPNPVCTTFSPTLPTCATHSYFFMQSPEQYMTINTICVATQYAITWTIYGDQYNLCSYSVCNPYTPLLHHNAYAYFLRTLFCSHSAHIPQSMRTNSNVRTKDKQSYCPVYFNCTF
jgi:hypothetical protein